MSAHAKNRLLVRSLYRNLLKWCRETPSNLSLSHLSHPVDGTLVKTSDDLRQSVRRSFRRENSDVKQDIRKALDGLRLLHSLDRKTLPPLHHDAEEKYGDVSDISSTCSSPKDWVDAVEWLPLIDEMKDQPYQPSDLPLFPLSSPLIPNGDSDDQPLPLYSYINDVPVHGMETPLRIFESRYRELYKDVLSNGSRRFVVPVAHPYHAGRFARYGWLYEIMQVEDVADQTRGQIHLVAHHLVTFPVRIDTIVNPTDWTTKTTYLRIQGEVLDEKPFARREDLNEISVTLQELMSKQKHYVLATRLFSGLTEDGIWGLASVWVNWLQMEALELQVKIAADIKQQTDKMGTEVVNSHMIQSIQAPFREELESLLTEASTLVPLLLQESPKEQCERMHNRIKSRLFQE